jgi:hypothetical protein
MLDARAQVVPTIRPEQGPATPPVRRAPGQAPSAGCLPFVVSC